MFPAIFSRTYPLKQVDQVLAALHADGFEGAQMNLSSFGLDSLPIQVPDRLIEAGKEAAAHFGIKLAALSGTYNMALPDKRERHAVRSRFSAVAEAARRMGAPIVTLCTGSRSPESMWTYHHENTTPQAWQDLTDELTFTLRVAEEFGLLLAIEPEPGNVICDAKAARRILDQFGSQRLKVVLDAANIVPLASVGLQERIVDEAVELLGSDIVLAHAKDVAQSGEIVPPGKGVIDLKRFTQKLARAGFDGALIGHGFDAVHTAEAAKTLRRLCDFAS